MKDCGGSKRTFGKRKRPLAMRLEAQAAAKAVQPTGSDHRKRRLVSAEGSGEGGAGGATAGAPLDVAVVLGALSLPSVI